MTVIVQAFVTRVKHRFGRRPFGRRDPADLLSETGDERLSANARAPNTRRPNNCLRTGVGER